MARRGKRHFINENQLSLFGALEAAFAPAGGIEEEIMAPVLDAVIEAASDKPLPVPVILNQRNYRLAAADLLLTTDLKAKYLANIEAIKLVKLLKAENRAPTEDEKRLLVKYSGWGGLPAVFGYDYRWQAEQKELKALLDESEYKAARASTTNAHYTPPAVIESIYAAAKRLGFKSGKVLEPACGTGHFIGLMPQEVSEASRITAIELDNITGQIASHLYPDASVKIAGFESFKGPNNTYDLSISNVPFGDYSVFDADYSGKGFLIHDYFFAKGLDKTRPGGLVAFVTSKGTLDKTNPKVRRYMAERAELVGAIRLPANTFKDIANTDVTADILFLRKLAPNEQPCGHAFTDLAVLAPEYCEGGREIEVNEYFAANPHMILGKMAMVSSQYGETAVCKGNGSDLALALADAISYLPENCLFATVPDMVEEKPAISITIDNDSGLKENAYTVLDDGRIAKRLGDQLIAQEKLAKTAIARIKDLIYLRDLLADLINAQISEYKSDAEVEVMRSALNSAYDLFVKKHGFINASANVKAFAGDPDIYRLLALENWDSQKQVATKADILSIRTARPYKPVESAGNAIEALMVCLNDRGRVNLAHMAKLTGHTDAAIEAELTEKGLIFLNPDNQSWETADEYLCGNVREKLAIAETAAHLDNRFEHNVEALKAVIPADLEAQEISAKLGASWIPASDIQAFFDELMGEKEAAEIANARLLGTWTVTVPQWNVKNSVANTETHGTKRKPAHEILELTLNQQNVRVLDPVPGEEGKYQLNATETEAAREKQFQMGEKFKAWIWEDAERRARLVRLYNDKFNNMRLREFSGEHLTLPGVATVINGKAFALRPHQRAAVWRILQQGIALLAHQVGLGKTYTACAAAMELRRLGLAKKVCIVVPNHMRQQFATEFQQLYPNAVLLVTTDADLEPANRKRLMSRLATSDFDACIITHSGFGKLPVAQERYEAYIEGEISALEEAIWEQQGKERDNKLIKQLESAKKKLEKKLKELQEKITKRQDNTITFEETGIDMVIVDESHLFKNLGYVSRMTRVAGLPNSDSERARDMFIKTQYILEKNNGRGLVFLSGTPIANSMAEMFTLMRYMMLPEMHKRGIAMFDAWAGNFGEHVTSLEIAPDGSGYRMNTRFARFVNLPELMGLFRSFADVKNADMVNLNLPKIEGGKPHVVVAKASDYLKEYVAGLVKRADKIRNGQVKPWEDNFLAITSDGRKAALDMRLVDSSMPDEPDSKVNMAVDNIHRIWLETTDKRGAQLVFCDLSTPTGGKGFSVYEDMRDKLIARGIPADEIAFIHDANTDTQKAALFAKVRAGIVRILFGSTSRMGAGTNVQTRLVANHDLDCPWRPADVEQRRGRIERQGNMNETVALYRYVTEGSFDSYQWQTVETKSKFINQVMTGDLTVRTAEDLENAALSYSEIKALASGNPLVLEKCATDQEVARYSRLKSAYEKNLFRMKDELVALPHSIERSRKEIAAMTADLGKRQDTAGDRFAMTINGQHYTDRKLAGEILREIARQAKQDNKLASRRQNLTIGSFAGLALEMDVPLSKIFDPVLIVRGEYQYHCELKDTDIGTILSLESLVRNIHQELVHKQNWLQQAEKKLADLSKEILKPFEYEEKLQNLLKRQNEINDALDLNKSDSGAAALDDGEGLKEAA